MAALKVTYKDPHQLKPRARNPRTHTAKQPSRECRRSGVVVRRATLRGTAHRFGVEARCITRLSLDTDGLLASSRGMCGDLCAVAIRSRALDILL